MATNRDGIPTPKLYKLTTQETLNSFEAWKQNIVYTLSLNPKMAPFLVRGALWHKADDDDPVRGLTDDEGGATKEQKVTQLELMLGLIANYCPIITRSTIVYNSKSIESVWQSIRLHFGFQTTGGHFLELADITLGVEERPEDLYQRIVAFVEDSLLRKDGSITHHGDVIAKNERVTPTLENFVVLHWLKLVHKDLPRLVRQRYATELRSRTLSSIKPEISLALDALLDELQTSHDLKVMRSDVTKFSGSKFSKPYSAGGSTRSGSYNRDNFPRNTKQCSLCKQAGRHNTNHFLSKCNFLSPEDRKFMTRVRCLEIDDTPDEYNENLNYEDIAHPTTARQVTDNTPCRRVDVEPSPYLDSFYRHKAVRITIDSGATGSFIRFSKVKELGIQIKKSSQSANQADGKTGLVVLGETSFSVSRDDHVLQLQCLVVQELDCDVLGGTSFQKFNDVYPRVKYGYVGIGDSKYFYSPSQEHDATPVCQLLRVENKITLWPDEFMELAIPDNIPDSIYAIEPRVDNNIKSTPDMWPSPSVIDSVGNKIRVKNNTNEPIVINKNSHVCNIRSVTCVNKSNDEYFHESISKYSDTANARTLTPTVNNNIHPFSQSVSLDPDNLMPNDVRDKFKSQLLEYDEVFNPCFPSYNNAFGPIRATVNMGPVLPPQRKGRMPLYGRNQLVELQEKFDELEEMGVFGKPEQLDVVAEYLNPSFLIKKPRGGFRFSHCLWGCRKILKATALPHA